MIGKGNHRHFMLKEIHEQPAVIGDTLHSYVDPGDPHGDAAGAAVRLRPRSAAVTMIGLRHRLLRRAWSPSTGSSSIARLPVEVEVASEFRYREPPLPGSGVCIARLPVGRDGRHAGGDALRQAPGPAHPVGGQRAGERDRARSRTSCCRPWPGRRSASPRPRPSPPS